MLKLRTKPLLAPLPVTCLALCRGQRNPEASWHYLKKKYIYIYYQNVIYYITFRGFE